MEGLFAESARMDTTALYPCQICREAVIALLCFCVKGILADEITGNNEMVLQHNYKTDLAEKSNEDSFELNASNFYITSEATQTKFVAHLGRCVSVSKPEVPGLVLDFIFSNLI